MIELFVVDTSNALKNNIILEELNLNYKNLMR